MEAIDWDSCIIFSKHTGNLKCPVDSYEYNGLEVYRNFLGIVEEFCSLDASPVDVKFEGDNLAEVFYQNKAKWHKSCHLKFSASKLLRVRAQREREKECASINDQRWSKRHSMANTVNEECCIFCSLPSGNSVFTLDVEFELLWNNLIRSD